MMTRFVRHLFPAVVFALVALLLVFALLHDSIYRWIAVEAMQQALGIDGTIDGEFDVVHGSPLKLDLAKMRVSLSTSEVDTPRASIGELHLRIRLWPLFRRQIQIEKLYIRDAEIELFSLNTPLQGAHEREQPFTLPLVEHLRLENVKVGFQLTDSGPRNQLRVFELEVATGTEGKLGVEGSGSLDGDAWALDGEFGSLGELMRPSSPFPLSVRILAPDWGLTVDARGSAGAPLTGENLALDLRAVTDDLTPMFGRLLPGTPFAGALEARAHLSGSVAAAMLSKLDLSIDDGDRFKLSATGTMPLSGRQEELDIEASVVTADAAVVRFLTRDQAPAIEALNLALHLHGEEDTYRVDRVVGKITGADGARAQVDGELRVGVPGSGSHLSDIVMDVTVDAPTALLAPWLPDALASAGHIQLVANLSGDPQHLRLERVAATVSADDGARFAVQGGLRIDRITDGWRPHEIALDLQVDTPAARLGPWLPEGFASAGRAQLAAKVTGDLQRLVVDAFELDMTETVPLRGKVRGDAQLVLAGLLSAPPDAAPATLSELVPGFNATLDIAARKGWMKSVGKLLELSVPALGPGTLKAAVRRDGDAWRFSNLDARVLGKNKLDARVRGTMTLSHGTGDTSALSGVDLRVITRGANAAAAEPLGLELPLDPGPWTLSARVRGKSNNLRVGEVHVEAGSEDAVLVRFTGRGGKVSSWLAADFASMHGVEMNGRLRLPNTRILGEILGKKVPDLGRLDTTFEARAGGSGWVIPRFEATLSGRSALTARVAGKITGLPGKPTVDANVQAESADMSAAGALLGVAPGLTGVLTLQGRLEGSAEQLSYAGKIKLDTSDLDARLELDLAGKRPLLSGSLTSPVLNAGRLGLVNRLARIGLDAYPPPPATAGAKLFDTRPLDLGLLALTDFDLRLTASEANVAGVDIGDLKVWLENKDRRFHLEVDDIDVAKGKITATVDVDASGETPLVHIKTHSEQLSLSELHGWVSNSEERMEGRFSHDLDVTASGNSPHGLASSMRGRISKAIVDANLVGGDLDLLDLRLMQLMLSMLSPSRRTTVECIISDFQIADGIATSETLFLETPKMLVAGTGTLDFGAETVDLLLTARTRRRLRILSNDHTFRVSGSLSALELEAEINVLSGGAAVTAGIVAAPVLAPVAGFSFITELLGGRGDSECEKAAASR